VGLVVEVFVCCGTVRRLKDAGVDRVVDANVDRVEGLVREVVEIGVVVEATTIKV
jgi:hypothetical protein